MNTIIVGCGRFGSTLATRLSRAGHAVAVIDLDPAAFKNLPADYNGRMHEGNALSKDVLERAGIESSDSIAVMTNSDALNMVIGHVARTVFHVDNVVVRNYDPRYRALFEEFDLQVVSSTSWAAQRIEEMLGDTSIHTVFSAGNGEVEIYELFVPEHWDNKNVDSILHLEECLPVSITRAGKALMPRPDLILQHGDILHVSATFEGINCLRESIRKGEQE